MNRAEKNSCLYCIYYIIAEGDKEGKIYSLLGGINAKWSGRRKGLCVCDCVCVLGGGLGIGGKANREGLPEK